MWSSLIFGNYHYTQKFVETTEKLLHILDDTHLESSRASFSEIGIQEAKSDDLKPSENISESLKHPYMTPGDETSGTHHLFSKLWRHVTDDNSLIIYGFSKIQDNTFDQPTVLGGRDRQDRSYYLPGKA